MLDVVAGPGLVLADLAAELIQGAIEVLGAGEPPHEAAADEGAADDLLQAGLERIARHQVEAAVARLPGQSLLVEPPVAGEPGGLDRRQEGAGVARDLLGLEHGKVELAREQLEQRILADRTHPHQDAAQPPAIALLEGQRLLQVLAAEQSGRQQELADRPAESSVSASSTAGGEAEAEARRGRASWPQYGCADRDSATWAAPGGLWPGCSRHQRRQASRKAASRPWVKWRGLPRGRPGARP